MAKLPAKYDVGLIQKMLGHFVATPKSAAERVLKLKVDALNSGMVVLQDIRDSKRLAFAFIQLTRYRDGVENSYDVA